MTYIVDIAHISGGFAFEVLPLIRYPTSVVQSNDFTIILISSMNKTDHRHVIRTQLLDKVSDQHSYKGSALPF